MFDYSDLSLTSQIIELMLMCCLFLISSRLIIIKLLVHFACIVGLAITGDILSCKDLNCLKDLQN